MASVEHEEGTASRKQFARILGERSPSYVTQLEAEGRLVLTADNKRVRVAESLALLRETADPAKAGVVARHAAARAAGDGEVPMVEEGDGPAPTGDSVTDGHARRRAKALADKAETDAKAAERDYQLSLGGLLRADEVEQVVRSAVVTFRGALENLQNTLAPQVATITDEAQARALFASEFEHALGELSRKFLTLSKRETA